MDLRSPLYSQRMQYPQIQAFLRLRVPSEGQGLQTTGLTSSSCQQWDAATDIIIVIVANQQYQESEDRHHYHQRGKHAGPCSICRSLILRYIAIMVELKSTHPLLLVTNLIAKPLPRPPTCLVPALPSAYCVIFVWYVHLIWAVCCELCYFLYVEAPCDLLWVLCHLLCVMLKMCCLLCWSCVPVIVSRVSMVIVSELLLSSAGVLRLETLPPSRRHRAGSRHNLCGLMP